MFRTKAVDDLRKLRDTQAPYGSSPVSTTDDSPIVDTERSVAPQSAPSPDSAASSTQEEAGRRQESAALRAEQYVRRFRELNRHTNRHTSVRPGGLPNFDETGRVIRVRHGSAFTFSYARPGAAQVVVYPKLDAVPSAQVSVPATEEAPSVPSDCGFM